MRTPYSSENQSFTNAAHALARTLIYPEFFGVDAACIRWKGHHLGSGGVSDVLDGELGIDRTASVLRKDCEGVYTTCIQERFRRMKYQNFRDITITKLNTLSGLPSELYKMIAGLFVYGYCDVDRGSFGEVVIVNVEILLDAISKKKIQTGPDEQNPRTGQTFVTAKIDQLLEVPGMVRWHRKPAEVTHAR